MTLFELILGQESRPRPDIGCITVDKRTGVYKTHTAEEWKARSMGDASAEEWKARCMGDASAEEWKVRSIGDASAEEWGDVIKTVAAARGKQAGRPIESVEVKDAKVEAKFEKLNALWPLWTVSTTTRAAVRMVASAQVLERAKIHTITVLARCSNTWLLSTYLRGRAAGAFFGIFLPPQDRPR